MSLDRTDRRSFLQAGALATAAAAGLSNQAGAQDPKEKAEPTPIVPRRVLGKTGAEITMLDQGAVRGPSLDSVLRLSYAAGVRTFDTAKVYGSEPNFKKWFEAPAGGPQDHLPRHQGRAPKRRPDDEVGRPAPRGVRHRLHRPLLPSRPRRRQLRRRALKLVTSKEYRDTDDAIRKTCKAKFIGFSTHCKDRATLIQKAAESGGVDAIMLQYTAWLGKDAPLNKALDVAHKAGIGLISMKQVAGRGPSGVVEGAPLKVTEQKLPWLKEKNLSVYQGLLHAIWTDERISASCVSMRNTDQIRENADAARRFEPASRRCTSTSFR